MQLETYFDFLAPDDIRIHGTRVGIETVLLDYLDLGLTAEQIALRYPSVALEAVYATLTYYWHNQAAVNQYLAAWKAHGERMRAEQAANPSPAVLRMREVLRQHDVARRTQPESSR